MTGTPLLAATISVALVMLRALPLARAAAPLGVCYSPFHSQDYFNNPGDIGALLRRDYTDIATQFSFVRTYHAQFYGESVVDAAVETGLKVAVGVQMLGGGGQPYEYLEDDITSVIEAAQRAPGNVVAIYVGNENLVHDGFGFTSADTIIEIINRIKDALSGTAAAGIPVGTVQRLEEWLRAPDAARLAEACDVCGTNIYAFFTEGGTAAMKQMLAVQWEEMTAIYGDKARLTETGWPSSGESSPQGNEASESNAQSYLDAFAEWAVESGAVTPFYFMMYDDASVQGPGYEQHFGVSADTGVTKLTVKSIDTTAAPSETPVESVSQTPVPEPAPTPAPGPEPAPSQIPEPEVTPTPEPVSPPAAEAPIPTPALKVDPSDTQGAVVATNVPGIEDTQPVIDLVATILALASPTPITSEPQSATALEPSPRKCRLRASTRSPQLYTDW